MDIDLIGWVAPGFVTELSSPTDEETSSYVRYGWKILILNQ